MTSADWAGLLLGGGVVLLCIVLGAVLMCGRGLMLIAGYNTMTPEERAKYNGKALGKAVGAYLIVVGVLTGAMIWCAAVGSMVMFWIGMGLILVGTVFVLIFTNKGKQFRNLGKSSENDQNKP